MTKFSRAVATVALSCALALCRISVAHAAIASITPAAPRDLAAAVTSSTQINLTWTDSSNNEIGFAVERSANATPFRQIATVGASTARYNDTGLSASTTYYYRVRAYNSAGYSTYSGAVAVETPGSGPTVTLQWDHAADPNVHGYRLYYGRSSGRYTDKIDVGNTTKTLVSNLVEGQTYFFAVTAYNAMSESARSNQISYTVPVTTTATASAAMVSTRASTAVRAAPTIMPTSELNSAHDMKVVPSRPRSSSVQASAYARWCAGEP